MLTLKPLKLSKAAARQRGAAQFDFSDFGPDGITGLKWQLNCDCAGLTSCYKSNARLWQKFRWHMEHSLVDSELASRFTAARATYVTYVTNKRLMPTG